MCIHANEYRLLSYTSRPVRNKLIQFKVLTISESASVTRKQAAPEKGAVPRVLGVETF